MNKLFLGELLIKEEYITYDQLSDALDFHNEDGRSFEKIFWKMVTLVKTTFSKLYLMNWVMATWISP